MLKARYMGDNMVLNSGPKKIYFAKIIDENREWLELVFDSNGYNESKHAWSHHLYLS